jgi:4-amino-4-deoxy-L-arabinose transferase-like glycosyltransferase
MSALRSTQGHSPTLAQFSEWWPVFLVAALAFGLRATLIGAHAFQMDEAYYAGFSRGILHGDVLVTRGALCDKPPFQFYCGALGMALFGVSDNSVRIIDCAMSAAECAVLVWALLPLAGSAAALGASLLLATAPLHRAYGASGLTDVPFSLALSLSCILALRGRANASAVAMGIALWSKQTAFFFLPLPFLFLAVAGGQPRALKRWAAITAFGGGALFAWSFLFQHPRLGFIVLERAGQSEVGPHLNGWGGRISVWIELGREILVWPGLFPVLAFLGLLVSVALAIQNRIAKAWALIPLIPAYGLLVYSLMGMRLFDRYFTPLTWALAAIPALGAAATAPKSWIGRCARWAVLALGMAAWLQSRTYAFSPENQGAPGQTSEGIHSVLGDLRRLSPDGGAALSDEGGLFWLGSWYLPAAWSCWDGATDSNFCRLFQDKPTRPIYWVGREPHVPPAGWRWTPAVREKDPRGGGDWVALRVIGTRACGPAVESR